MSLARLAGLQTMYQAEFASDLDDLYGVYSYQPSSSFASMPHMVGQHPCPYPPAPATYAAANDPSVSHCQAYSPLLLVPGGYWTHHIFTSACPIPPAPAIPPPPPIPPALPTPPPPPIPPASFVHSSGLGVTVPSSALAATMPDVHTSSMFSLPMVADGIVIDAADVHFHDGPWAASSDSMQRHRLPKEILKIEGVLSDTELSDIWQCLQEPEFQQKLEAATRSIQSANFPHWSLIRSRVSGLPFLKHLKCKSKRFRVQASAFPGMVHKDTVSYTWRAVFRFPADGVSTTKLDLHPDLFSFSPFASVLIKPGQGYLISQEAGCKLWAHNVPTGFHGVSLILDYV